MIRTAHTTRDLLGNVMHNQVLKIKVLCQAQIHLTNLGEDHTVLSVKALITGQKIVPTKMSRQNVQRMLRS